MGMLPPGIKSAAAVPAVRLTVAARPSLDIRAVIPGCAAVTALALLIAIHAINKNSSLLLPLI